jgi:hypothetical protein
MDLGSWTTAATDDALGQLQQADADVHSDSASETECDCCCYQGH